MIPHWIRDLIESVPPEYLRPGILLFGLFFLLMLLAGVVLDVILLATRRFDPPAWRERVERLRARPWTWRQLVPAALIIAAAHGLFTLMIYARSRFFPETAREISPAIIVIASLVFDGTAILTILYFMAVKNRSWKEYFGLSGSDLLRNVGRGIMFYVAMMPSIVIVNVVYRLFLEASGYPVREEQQQLVAAFRNTMFPAWVKIHIAVTAILLAPLAEELLFRGIALPVLSRHIRIWLNVVFVSVLFACIHQNLPSVPQLFMIACAFSVAYIYSGSIVTSVVMHAAFNSVAIVTLLMFPDIPDLAACL